MAGKKAEQAMQALAGMVGDVGEAAPSPAAARRASDDANKVADHSRGGGPVFTERGKLRETKVNRTPMADVSAEAVRDMLSTPEGVQRLLALTPKQQSLVRARLASANRAWADDFDEVLSSPEPKTARKLDSGFEGPDADPDQEVVGLGADDSLPADPERVASPRRSMGNDRLLDRPSRKVGDASFPIAKQPEARAPYDRMSANAPFMAQKLPERRLALAQKAVREQVGQWLRATKPIDPSTKKPYTLDAYLAVASKQDIDRVVSGTPVGVRRRTSKVTGKDEIASGFVDDSQQTNRLEGGMASQEQRQADRVTRAAGTNPSGHSRTLRRDGGNGANTLTEDGFQEDVAQSSMPPLVSSRPAQGAHERAFDSVNALRDTFKEGADSMLVALRHADDDKAAELAYGAAHDIVNRMFPNTESMTAVARRDAVHGVATGLLSSVDRRINVLPKSVVDADLAAVRATNEAFPPVPRTPVPEPRPSRPTPMDDSWRSAATTRDIQPGPEARLPTPEYNGSGRKPPRNPEEMIADYYAGRPLSDEDKAVVEDVIAARKDYIDSLPKQAAPAEAKPKAARKRPTAQPQDNTLPPVPAEMTPVKTKGRKQATAAAKPAAETPVAPTPAKRGAQSAPKDDGLPPVPAKLVEPEAEQFVGGERVAMGGTINETRPAGRWSADNEAAAEQVFRSTFKAAIDSGADLETARDAANAARKAKAAELYGSPAPAAPAPAATPVAKGGKTKPSPTDVSVTETPVVTKPKRNKQTTAAEAPAVEKTAATADDTLPPVPAEMTAPTPVKKKGSKQAPAEAKPKKAASKAAPAAEQAAVENDPWELGRDGGDGLDDPAVAPTPAATGQAIPPHVRARPAGQRPAPTPKQKPSPTPTPTPTPAPPAAAAGTTGGRWGRDAAWATGGVVTTLAGLGIANRNPPGEAPADDLSRNLGAGGSAESSDGVDARDAITMLERIRIANRMRNAESPLDLILGGLGNAHVSEQDIRRAGL